MVPKQAASTSLEFRINTAARVSYICKSSHLLHRTRTVFLCCEGKPKKVADICPLWPAHCHKQGFNREHTCTVLETPQSPTINYHQLTAKANDITLSKVLQAAGMRKQALKQVLVFSGVPCATQLPRSPAVAQYWWLLCQGGGVQVCLW